MVQLQFRETFHDCSTAASSSDLNGMTHKMFGGGGGGGGCTGTHMFDPPQVYMNVFSVVLNGGGGGGGGASPIRAFARILCHVNGGQ